jgi:hypothetical protein
MGPQSLVSIPYPRVPPEVVSSHLPSSISSGVLASIVAMFSRGAQRLHCADKHTPSLSI